MLDLLQSLLANHPIEASCGLLAVFVMTMLTAYHAFAPITSSPSTIKASDTTSTMGSAASSENMEETEKVTEKVSAAASAKSAPADAPTTMALIVRTDLGMGHGKVAAQCAHASVAAVEKCMEGSNTRWAYWLQRWLEVDSSSTATYKVSSEGALPKLAAAAKAAGVPYYLVRDAGRTQIAAGSRTVVSVGPAPLEAVQILTSGLESL